MKRAFLFGLLCWMTLACPWLQAQTLFGVKGGVTLPRLYYTNPSLGKLTHIDTLRYPSTSLFVEFPLYDNLTLAPELNRQYRGGIVSHPNPGHGTTTYQMDACYLSLRVPVCVYLTPNETFTPYFLAGPDVGFAYKGKISLNQSGMPTSQQEVAINGYNLNRFLVGAMVGAGIRLNLNISRVIFVVKLDTALDWGFTDTFSAHEIDETSQATNVYAYHHQGARLLRGLEAHLSIGCIFKGGLKDACGNFQNTYKRKKVSYVW